MKQLKVKKNEYAYFLMNKIDEGNKKKGRPTAGNAYRPSMARGRKTIKTKLMSFRIYKRCKTRKFNYEKLYCWKQRFSETKYNARN